MAKASPPIDSARDEANGEAGNEASGENRQPDIGALARQYVDLWQQQLSGAASDEALASVMAQTVQLMNAGATAMASYATSQAPQAGQPEQAGQATTAPDDTKGNNGGNNDGGDTRAAPVAASSGADVAAVDELHRRIEQLEKRITALESGTGGKGA